ncbi:PWWP domain-containing protein MUM1L1-like [Sus scrofa]|nr:PWWP domain-containing protein MUM1L1-like [Sus scrofa]
MAPSPPGSPKRPRRKCRAPKGNLPGRRRKSREPTAASLPSESRGGGGSGGGDKSLGLAALTPDPGEMQTAPPGSSRPCPHALARSEDAREKGGKGRQDTSRGWTWPRPAQEEGAGARGRGGRPRPKALKEAARGLCPETPAVSRGRPSSAGKGQAAGASARDPALEGAAAPSGAPNTRRRSSLRPASRKRKRQAAEGAEGRRDPPSSLASKAGGAPGAGEQGVGRGAGRPAGRALPPEPCAIERGTMVWFKFQNHPFWPAVVKSVSPAEQTARVLLIEADMPRESSGIRVPLRRLKPLDCAGQEKLLERARKVYGQGVNWCFSLISHYRDGLGRGSFAGSFLDYFAADCSYPLRRAIQEGPLRVDFPKVNYADLEDSEDEAALGGRKILPDRMRAARDRANQKLVDFIVKRKGADPHLLDIVKGRKRSRWLASFLRSGRYVICVETYLEDDDQLDVVVRHLQDIYREIDRNVLALTRDDKVSFVLEVLLPEAIICSIAALDGLDYKQAEQKYLQGPPVRYREKELFDRKVLRELSKRSARRLRAK